MNKNFSIAIVAVIILIAGVSVWMITHPKNSDQSGQNDMTEMGQQEQKNSPNVNMTQQDLVEINIQDYKFTPANITIKKGTTVVWTNQDNVGHNVVSSSGAPAGGPPSEAPLLGKNQQFTFTYDTIGTFDYHCSPHPYMTGSVTVEE